MHHAIFMYHIALLIKEAFLWCSTPPLFQKQCSAQAVR